MSKYVELFFPATSSLSEIDRTMGFFAMMVFTAFSILYIMFTIKHLGLIFKNRDNSLRQNSYIIFKVLTILLLSYAVFEIVNIILEIS